MRKIIGFRTLCVGLGIWVGTVVVSAQGEFKALPWSQRDVYKRQAKQDLRITVYEWKNKEKIVYSKEIKGISLNKGMNELKIGGRTGFPPLYRRTRFPLGNGTFPSLCPPAG